MKVVLDTNVVVSGLLRPDGKPAEVLNLVLAGAIQICHSDEILAEYREVLARERFGFDPQRVREVLEKIEIDGLSVNAASVEKLNLPDRDDEPFLAAACAASADFLITGNLIHYPEPERKGCAVVPPATFLKLWQQHRDQ